MPLFGPPVRLRPFFGYRNERRLRLSARAIRVVGSRGEAGEWQRPTTFGRLRTMWSHFASREVPDVAVTIEARRADGGTIESIAATDGEGYVHFDLSLGEGWVMPDRTSWETVTLRWVARDGAQEVAGYVLAPGRDHRLAVISDIDDTILETGAHDLARNWRRVLAQMPGERLPVPGAAEFYARLGGSAAGASLPATFRPFFYISSSPWNLFDYLLAFKKAHGLPQGPMLLRDWGLDRATIGKAGHGLHKSSAIAALADFYAQTRFALIGDSTQADAIAFGDAVAAHPGRIAGVFIRKAPGASIGPEERAALDAIEAAGVPLWLGESFAVEESFLSVMGFAKASDAEAVVKATGTQPASPRVQASNP